jgi:hypothetical protein
MVRAHEPAGLGRRCKIEPICPDDGVLGFGGAALARAVEPVAVHCGAVDDDHGVGHPARHKGHPWDRRARRARRDLVVARSRGERAVERDVAQPPVATPSPGVDPAVGAERGRVHAPGRDCDRGHCSQRTTAHAARVRHAKLARAKSELP